MSLPEGLVGMGYAGIAGVFTCKFGGNGLGRDSRCLVGEVQRGKKRDSLFMGGNPPIS